MDSNKDNSFRPKTVDPVAFSRQLMVSFLFIVTVVFSGFAVKSGNVVFMVGLVGLPFALILMSRSRLALILALIFNASQIPMPGFHAGSLGLLFQLILIVTYFAGVFVGGNKFENKKLPGYRMLVLYAIWLIVLMAVRGTGLRALGSTTWGGQKYIIQFVAIGMFFVCSNISIKAKHIRWIVWGGVIAGIIGSFVAFKTGSYLSVEGAGEVNNARKAYLSAFYFSFIPIVFAYKAKRIKIINVGLLVLAVLLLSLTGFRNRLIIFAMLVYLYGYVKSKNKIWYTAGMIIAGLVAWGLVVFITPSLPLEMQRTFSFIPGVQVAQEVATSALNSTEWRIEQWKFALAHSHQYFIIGRGMTINVNYIVQSAGVNDLGSAGQWFMYQLHNYHSGPLALLIDLGIPGMLMFLVFSRYAFREMWRNAKLMVKFDTFESRFALFSCMYVFLRFVGFYLIYGDVSQIGELIVMYALANLFTKSVLDEEESRRVLLEDEVECVKGVPG